MPALRRAIPMLIECPACAKTYRVSGAAIGAAGRTVVCSLCDTHWVVAGDNPGEKLAPCPSDLRTAAISTRASASLDESVRHPSLFKRVRPVLGAFACIALVMLLIGQRDRVVRLVPRTARLYAALGMPVNVRGLAFAAIAPARADAGSGDLTISGEIRNVAARRVRVPRLAYEVRNAAGVPLAKWSEGAPARTLGTGKVLAFASLPHAIPPEGQVVLVRFEADELQDTPIRIVRRDEK